MDTSNVSSLVSPNSALKEWWKANTVEADKRKDGMIISMSGQS